MQVAPRQVFLEDFFSSASKTAIIPPDAASGTFVASCVFGPNVTKANSSSKLIFFENKPIMKLREGAILARSPAQVSAADYGRIENKMMSSALMATSLKSCLFILSRPIQSG